MENTTVSQTGVNNLNQVKSNEPYVFATYLNLPTKSTDFTPKPTIRYTAKK